MGCCMSLPNQPPPRVHLADNKGDPLSLMPAELWDKVLSYLEEDPHSLVHASESCPLFEALLQDKGDASSLEQVLPHVFTWLRFKDALNLRRTCKRIQSRVDNMLEHWPLLNHPQNQLTSLCPKRSKPLSSGLYMEGYLRYTYGQGVTLKSLRQVERFRDKMKRSLNTPWGRPFVGKFLALGSHSDDISFLQPAIQLIGRFQTKLIHLDISKLSLNHISLIERYQVIRKMLMKLPNLESFRGPRMANSQSFGMFYDAVDLRLFIDENPLPPLPFIKRMEFGNMTTGLFKEIVSKYGDKLESITLGNLFNHPEHLPVIKFPALVEMELRLKWRNRGFLERIEAPSLASLRLNLSFSFWSDVIIFPQAFYKILQGFPNLVTFQLEILKVPKELDASEKRTARIQHPSVKKFVIRSSTGFVPVSLRFFVEMFPKLEVLMLHDNIFDHSGKKDPDLGLLGGCRMNESTLWTRAPSLQLVQRNSIKFTRAEYLKYLKRQKRRHPK